MSERLTDGRDIIDSREIIERIDYLSVIRQAGPVPDGELDDEDAETDQDELFAELAALEAFRDEVSGYCADWEYGEAFISDDYFEDYARELAEDIGAVPSDYSWPASHIDWEAAATALQQDYASAELEGVTYWFR